MMTTTGDEIELAARDGVAIPLRSGQRLRVINTHGTQIVDMWALSTDDPGEYLSVEHTRRMTGHLHPVAGDTLWSNRRHEMLSLEEDTFPGTHDTLVACCDRWLYAHYGCPDGHASCRDNYLDALAQLGIASPHVPNPLNLWMNVPVEGNAVSIAEPLSRPGDHVLFLAERDVIVVLSACPMDVPPSAGAVAINGPDCTPRPVHYTVL